MSARVLLSAFAAMSLLMSCGSPPRAATASASARDPLGPRPQPAPAPAFVPQAAVAFAGPGGSKVLLLERHALPLVAVSVVVPFGSSSDPADQPGLAHVAASMIDQGAGQLDAVAFSQALDDLGAQLVSAADGDASTVSLQCLPVRLPEALPLLFSTLSQPRHGPEDFTRVASLWTDALKQRQDDAEDAAQVVATVSFYGRAHPYGHPAAGLLSAAERITLDGVDRWHRAIWRPDLATIVVVGDATRPQVEDLLARAAVGWRAPDEPPPQVVTPAAPTASRARTIVVDRPEAPQVVAVLVRSGIAAQDPNRAALDALNVALGGSFTSRLNQDLREDHGWTYGVHSRFSRQRGPGAFLASAAIRADAITEALREMRAVISAVAKDGIGAEELEKSRSQFQGDLVDAYGTVWGVASRLARQAGLGLGPDDDLRELADQRRATVAEVAAAARANLGIDSAVLVLVGPKEPILKALADNALPSAEFCDGEGVGLDQAAPTPP